MKPRITLAALALAALVAAGCGSHSKRTSTAASISGKKCAATIAIEGPFTGPDAPLGREQLHFAQQAVANDDAADHMNVTLVEDDTQMTPAIALRRAESIIASNPVAVVGPAGSSEVEAVGPLFARAGMAFVSGSATLPALTSGGTNPTFFRVVPDDDIQGSEDADYTISHLHPKAVMIFDDDDAYSRELVKAMMLVFERARVEVMHVTYSGVGTGSSAAGVLSSLASKVTRPVTIVMLPWQNAANAQQLGLDLKKQGKRVTLFGTGGIDSPSEFTIAGSYVSASGPGISASSSPLAKSIVAGGSKYGPYGASGIPTYEAADVVMKAIASVCKGGEMPNRADVLAAVRKTSIPASANPLGIPVAFASNGNLAGDYGYLFKIEANGEYAQILPR